MQQTGDHHIRGACLRTSQPPLRRRLAAAGLAVSIGLATAVTGTEPAGAATASAVTGRVSVTSAGAGLTASTEGRTAIDAGGRYVAFSGVGTYGGSDTNDKVDVFVRDRTAGTTTRVSVTDAEAQLDGESVLCGASADVRFLAFWSNATNLPAGGTGQIYVRDRVGDTTRLASIGASGLASTKPGGGSGIHEGHRCDVSGDGRYVVFASEGTNLVVDGNGVADVFRRDLVAGTTVRVSVSDAEGELAGFGSSEPQISDSGNMVVFDTAAVVAPGDANGKVDVYLRDVSAGTTTAMSLEPDGSYPDGLSSGSAISGDGSVVAFASSGDLDPAAPDDNGSASDIYVRPTSGGPATRVSVSSTEDQGDDDSYGASLSHDGRYVAFTSTAGNLWAFEGNDEADAFVRDRQAGLTALASRRAESLVSSSVGSTGRPAISADGTAVAFTSLAPDLVREDTVGRDVFVRDTAVDHAPFDSFAAFVAQQFADFEGRAPTPTEAAEWKSRLVHNELSPDEVIADLAHGASWSGRRAPVTRLYWAFFLRAPDAAGLDYWVAQNAAGKGLHTIAGQFALSPEFKTIYGALSNQAFVTLVYQNVLERNPAPNEVAYWTQQLATGAKTRGSVMVGFSESPEGRRFLAPQVDVVLVHLGMLRTIPPKAMFTGYVAWIEGGTPLEEVVSELRYADDYVDRVA